MNEIISFSFWFNSSPEAIGLTGQKILGAIGTISAIFFIIIIIKAYSEKLHIYKPSIDRFKSFFITNIIVSAYIAFINYELIPVLRARIWYIIWLIIMIIWIIVIIKDFVKRAKKREELSKEAEKKKYIP